MYFAFVDDVKQLRPTRPEMGPLIGVGALLVHCDELRQLEQELYQLCVESKFPVADHRASEFKWSPGRELWMSQNLIGAAREKFLLGVMQLLKQHAARLIAVLEDELYNVADKESPNHEIDATRLLFERINRFLGDKQENAVVVYDRPSGGRSHENDFLAASIEMLREGTRFVKFDRIALNLLCTQSRFLRLLQAVDVAVGCVGAYVSGEEKYSPAIFASVRPLFVSGVAGIGGLGLKLHPEYKHANLYHWLLGDSCLFRMNTGVSLPMTRRPHSEKPRHIKACELWRKVIAEVRTRRPLILRWIELARPYRLENGTLTVLFQLEERLAAESLSRPNNLKFVKSILTEINGESTELKHELLA